MRSGHESFNHQWKQQSLNISFDQHSGVGEEEIAMRQLDVLLEEVARVGTSSSS